MSRSSDTPRASHTLKRVLTILKVLVAQLDILETMTPLEFLSFRDRLESGSGFQSYQFRELELALGHKRRDIMKHFEDNPAALQRLEKRYGGATLWDAFLRYLGANGFAVPAAQLERDVTEPIEPSADLQAILVSVYRTNPTITEVCERLVDLDEGFQEWRYRHVKMVQRTIGTRQGTGGSDGAAYLRSTLFKPVFPDLWEIRTRF